MCVVRNVCVCVGGGGLVAAHNFKGQVGHIVACVCEQWVLCVVRMTCVLTRGVTESPALAAAKQIRRDHARARALAHACTRERALARAHVHARARARTGATHRRSSLQTGKAASQHTAETCRSRGAIDM